MAQTIILMAAATFIRQMLDKPKATRSIPELTEMQIQGSEYGVAISQVYGGMRIAGNVIWASEIIDRVYKGTVLAKWLSLAIGICVGPMDRLLRIWADGDLILDNTGDNSSVVELQDLKITFYAGDETQEADPVMESVEGTGNVPAYRGLCYVVIEDFPLEAFDNGVPNFEFEIVSSINEVVSYVELSGVTAAATDKDHIVFYPDGFHFLIQSNNIWYKIQTLSNSIVLEVIHNDPEIPLNDGGFDIDENGVIHTCKEGGSGFAKLCRLDGDTLAELVADTTQINYARVIRVFRSTIHPYLVGVLINGGIGETLYVTHRESYTGDISLSAPSGTDWASIDLDEDNGIVWAVCTGQIAASNTKIVRIDLFGNGTYTQQIWEVTSNIERGDTIMFDSDTNQIIIGSSSQTKLAFFDAGDMSYLGQIDFSGTDFYLESAFRQGASNGYLYFALLNLSDGYHTAYEIDIANRQQSDSWALDESGVCGCGSGDTGGSCYDPLTHSVIIACCIDSTTDYLKMLLNRGQSSSVSLSGIVEDICSQVGLDGSGDVDTSDLTAFVDGYALIQRATARDALEALMLAFFFDCIDTGGALTFLTRGGNAVLNIPEDDLAAYHAGNERPQQLLSTRRQELELPVSVDVAYIDVDSNYSVGEQSERRLITQSQEILTLRLPIAMSADSAKQIAVIRLAAEWAGRTRHTVITHRGYTWLDPADVITVTEGDFVHTTMIDKMAYGGGLVTLHLINENSAVYESDAIGSELPPEEPGVDEPGPTLLVLIDCPLANSANNSVGIYVATLGYTESWTGAHVLQSAHGVWTGFERPIDISYKDAIIGKSTTVLPNVTDPWIWDEGSEVNIRLLDGADILSSASESAVLNGANVAILGDEIIQWKTATLENDGSYTLSGLLRGRYGSEWAMESHEVGEYFLPLDESIITFLELPEDDINIVRWYRAQTHKSFTFSVTQPFTYLSRNMMPLSPQHIAGTRDGSNNLTIRWTRRTRIGGEWADGGDVALGETAESYSLDVYDGSIIVRTIAITAETASYTAAQQVTDFGSTQAAIDIIVYQISSVVGRGFGTEATV